ncbi:unnamed protein product [Alopecurus aequalis]
MESSLLRQTRLATIAAQPSRRSRRLQAQKQDWSTVLPLELWEHISKRLPSGRRDAANFRSTCRLWRAALPFTKFAPVLMLQVHGESRDGATAFYRPTDGEAFTKNLPALHGRVVCGSSHGWLALVDEAACLTLLNPFTGATVALPRTDGRFSFLFWRFLVDGRWVTQSPLGGAAREIKLAEMRKLFITEVVLSSPADSGDCIAIALLRGSWNVAYCRVGVDASWKLLNTKLMHQVSSVVQCRNRFLAISCTGQVSICNLFGATPTARLVQGLDLPTNVSPRAYLQVNGKLHMVAHSCPTRVYECNVFSRTPLWSRVHNAGDLTLLTSHNFMTGHGRASVSGLDKNSVYFPVYIPPEHRRSNHLWFVISNIANGTTKMHPCHQNTDGTSEPLCWIIPKP